MISLLILPNSAKAEFDPDSITTPFIILMDAGSGSILYEKHSHEPLYPASTTKVMTALLTIEKCPDLNVVVNSGSSVIHSGSVMGLSRNEDIRIIDLLYGLMLKSGNDAAKVLAEHISGSMEEFAKLMNARAKELGMNDTHFVNANGLHEEDHKTTAYDMALLTKYAMTLPMFREVVKTGTYNVPATNKHSDGFALENSNKLIHTKADAKASFEYSYATGIKTGDTTQAGRCLIASAKKGDVELLLLLFGDYENSVSGDYRFENAISFFDWGFENYTSISATELGLQTEFEFPVSNANVSETGSASLAAAANLSGLFVSGLNSFIDELKTNMDSITATHVLDKQLVAPIAKDEVIGTVAYQYEGRTLLTADLVASGDVLDVASTAAPDVAPIASPLPDPSAANSGKGNNSWIFWVLLAVLLIVIVVIAKVISARRRRWRNNRRRIYRAPRRR